MDFLSRLFGSSGAKSKSKAGYVRREGRHAVWIYVQCSRCGEKIPVRLRTTSGAAAAGGARRLSWGLDSFS